MQKLLCKLNKKGKPVQGTINALATKYEVCKKTITRLWKEVQNNGKTTTQPSTSTIRGLRDKHPKRFNLMRKNSSPSKFELKGTQHLVAKQIKVSQSMVCRWKKDKVIRKHINAIKPTLNDNS